MSSHIIWTFLLKFYYVKIIWIFIFIILFVASFILVTFRDKKEELKKRVFAEEDDEIKMNDSVDRELLNFKENLQENENLLMETRKKIDETEQVLQNVESQNRKIHNNHKMFVHEMKQELLNTEKEIEQLIFDISNLAERREMIKKEVFKHQETCRNIVLNSQTNYGTNIIE